MTGTHIIDYIFYTFCFSIVVYQWYIFNLISDHYDTHFILSHLSCQRAILKILYLLSLLSTHFYSYFLVSEAVIRVLINVPSGSLISCITASILYCMIHHIIWHWMWCRSEWCRIRGLAAKCFPHSHLPGAVYCTVAWRGKNLFCRGFINIGCGPCMPACLSLPALLLHCMLTEMSAGCLARSLPVM